MLHKNQTGGGHIVPLGALSTRSACERNFASAAAARSDSGTSISQASCDGRAHTGSDAGTEDRMLRARARASVCGRHGYTVSVHSSCRRHTPVCDARRSIEFDKTTPSARPNGARRAPRNDCGFRSRHSTHLSAFSPQTQPGAKLAWACYLTNYCLQSDAS
jgi:hypothetical protein